MTNKTILLLILILFVFPPSYAKTLTEGKAYDEMYKKEINLNRCLIFARDAHSFAIEGYGTIDGNGYREFFSKGRPMLMRFLNCSNIHLNNISLINPASWTSAWLYCNNIIVNGITIISRSNGNSDGHDFDGCTNVSGNATVESENSKT